MPTLHIVKPGLLTTVQDLGRWGWQARGVPVAGPMDPYAHRVANLLVGNEPGAASIEVTLVGPEIEFEGEGIVAVAGAEFDIALDSRSVPMNTPIVAGSGSVLRFGRRHRGARAYLAVGGGVDVTPVLGSRSTHVASGMGGHHGRPLKAADRLPVGVGKRGPVSFPKKTPVPFFRLPDNGSATIRVLAGPQQHLFVADAFDVLQSAPYVVGTNSDRMGFRLDGPKLTAVPAASFISDATPLGSIQAPPSGLPIVLMADRPTTGGYPKIATVIGADVGLAGQLGPGDRMSFVICSRKEAMAALIEQERAVTALESPDSA